MYGIFPLDNMVKQINRYGVCGNYYWLVVDLPKFPTEWKPPTSNDKGGTPIVISSKGPTRKYHDL